MSRTHFGLVHFSPLGSYSLWVIPPYPLGPWPQRDNCELLVELSISRWRGRGGDPNSTLSIWGTSSSTGSLSRTGEAELLKALMPLWGQKGPEDTSLLERDLY